MKMNKFWTIASLFVAILVILVSGVTASAATHKKDAQPKYLTTLPANMRGTWYAYDGDKLVTTKVTAKSITIQYEGEKANKGTLHKYVDHNPLKMSKKAIKKTENWFFATNNPQKIHGYKWVWTYGWQQTAGSGEYYAVTTYQGHKVLTDADGAGVWANSHSFKTKALAAKYKDAKLPKFSYR